MRAIDGYFNAYLLRHHATTRLQRWRGVVASVVRRMNEVTLRRAPVSTGMGDRLWAGIPSRYVTSQLGQLSLASPGVARSSTSFSWGKGWNVTSAGWQVSLCDPIWHVSSSSGVATSVRELLYPCYFTLVYFTLLQLAIKTLYSTS